MLRCQAWGVASLWFKIVSLAGSRRTARDCMVPVMAGESWLLVLVPVKWREMKGCLSDLGANGSIARSLPLWNHKTYRLLSPLSAIYWFKIDLGTSRFYPFISSQTSPKEVQREFCLRVCFSASISHRCLCKSNTNGPA